MLKDEYIIHANTTLLPSSKQSGDFGLTMTRGVWWNSPPTTAIINNTSAYWYPHIFMYSTVFLRKTSNTFGIDFSVLLYLRKSKTTFKYLII